MPRPPFVLPSVFSPVLSRVVVPACFRSSAELEALLS